MRYFIEVVREGSISAAAKRLGMTQPPLSAAISSLETELGVRLLERTSKGVRPTAAGRHLMDRGGRLVQETRDLTRELQGHGRGVVGTLHLAVHMPFSWAYLPTYLKAFGTSAPGVEVTIQDLAPDDVLDGVASGAYDLAFMSTSNLDLIRTTYASSLVVDSVRSLELVLLTSENFPLTDDPLHLSQLMDETWLVPDWAPRFPGVTEILREEWRALKMGAPHRKVVQNLMVALPLISAGMGIGVAPPETASLSIDGITTRNLSPALPPLDLLLIRDRKRDPHEAAQRFIEVVRGVQG